MSPAPPLAPGICVLPPDGDAPWYAGGLRFACTRCGNCCTGAPGSTWVDEAEVERLAARIGLDREAFLAAYTRTLVRNGRPMVSLREKANHDCVFWAAGTGCTVYADRPRQCRTWPFWRVNLVDGDAWEAAGGGCPGINRGALHPAATIAATAAADGLPD